MGFGIQNQRYQYGYWFYDVATYPATDWKAWLNFFAPSKATERSQALQRRTPLEAIAPGLASQTWEVG